MNQHSTHQGRLVVVATPLGNLGDLSRRALELLDQADVVYCEDTRRSSTLFSAHDISVRGRLRALHEHNEASLCAEVVERVGEGQLVVLVSDAGTPGISDPGTRVVAAVAEAGLVVTTAPGPSAVVAALSVSGLATERFCMEGFVPRRASERARRFEHWASEERTIVFYESPQRLVATLRELVAIDDTRRVVVARELTKLHEEVIRGTLASVLATLEGREVIGEVVVVLDGAAAPAGPLEDDVRAARVAQFALGVSTRDAVSAVAGSLRVAHRDVYRLALTLRDGDAR